MSLSMQTAVFCMFTESLAESVIVLAILYFVLLKYFIQLILINVNTKLLTFKSTMISDTIYQSQWTNCDQKSKMTLLIIMIRAQKEFKCTAYGIIDLNHNQMKQVIILIF